MSIRLVARRLVPALFCLVVAICGAASLSGGEPPLNPYSVLRQPSDLKSSSRTSLQSYRQPTYVSPKLRQPYAYGWFGVKAQPQVERQRGYHNLKSRWVWK